MTHARFGSFALGALLALSACNDPTKGKPKAEVSNADPAAPAAPASQGAEVLQIESASSKVEWAASKITKSHTGQFKQFKGTADLVNGKAEGGRVTVEIDTASIESDNEKLTGHLKSPDFFDVEKFPKATFTSTEINPGATAPATHTVAGTLELHGVKKTISFPATINITDSDAALKAEFSINRKDFNISYPGAPDDLIKDDVLLKLDVKAKRKKK
jgi:polyisoprenoid-binding protein YceI